MNTQDIVNVSGLTYRQIDHAVRKGWLKPDNTHGKGTNNGREWTQGEYNIAVIAGRLVRAGFHTEQAMGIARRSEIDNPQVSSYELYLGYGVSIVIARR